MNNKYPLIKFIPEDNVILDIINKIKRAQHSILVAMFWFNYKPIADALIKASESGVKVKIFVDKRSLLYMYDSENRFKMSIPEYLKNNNVKVKIYYGTKNIFHHKIVLIDSKLLIISSFNWHHNDILHNYDFYLVIDDKKLCSTIKSWFAKLDQSNNFKYLILKSKSLKKNNKKIIKFILLFLLSSILTISIIINYKYYLGS